MAQVKTNERVGTRAVLRYSRTSAFKIRPVLDLIRGQEVERAREILRYSDRDAARLVDKLLNSAVANAENNDSLDPEELYVSACYADEATTMRRWRPRARGRATRIRKRSCHVTVIVSRMPEERLARMRARQAQAAGSRSRRVAAGRQGRRQRRRQEAAEQTIVAQPAAAAEEVEELRDVEAVEEIEAVPEVEDVETAPDIEDVGEPEDVEEPADVEQEEETTDMTSQESEEGGKPAPSSDDDDGAS